MNLDIRKELAALERMTVGELKQRFAEVFGEATRSRHKRYLVRRIAWGLQARAEGGLSERALRRAEELADLAYVRTTPPKETTARRGDMGSSVVRPVRTADPRVPSPGTVITRRYKGRTVAVTVLDDGFEYKGQRYRSLSAVAKAVTGSHINGFRFFALGERE